MKRHYIYTVFLVILIALAFSCEKNRVAKGRAEHTISINKDSDIVETIHLEGGDWGYPTPYAAYPRGPGVYKMHLIFDSLLERGEKGLIPWLAESWQILENGNQYLFTIREGVIWQDGRPLTAEDVKFSLEYASRYPMVRDLVYQKIKKVDVEAKQKIRVFVTEPSSTMLYHIGWNPIIPKHIWNNVKNPRQFLTSEATIGSGPYRLQDYNKTLGSYKFEAFDRFWGPKQQIRNIEFVPVSQAILAFEKGDIDLTIAFPDLIPRFRKFPEYKIVRGPAFWGYRLLLNMKDRPVFKQKKIRHAIRYAIDMDELVKKVARGAAIPGSAGVLPPDHVMHNPNVKNYHYDPEKAKKLFEEVGYTRIDSSGIRYSESGQKLQFELLCGTHEGRMQEVRIAELIRERLAQVGIHIHVRSMDYRSRDVRVHQGDFELAIIGHGGWGADPDYLRTRFLPSSSKRGFSPSEYGISENHHPRLLELLEQQHVEMDMLKRRKLVDEIQMIVAEELPEIPLINLTEYTVYRYQKYDGWQFMFDHHYLSHGKLSYLKGYSKKTSSRFSDGTTSSAVSLAPQNSTTTFPSSRFLTSKVLALRNARSGLFKHSLRKEPLRSR